MILPPQGSDSFNNQLESGKTGLQRVMQSLTKIQIRSAKASVEADENLVKELIMKGSNNLGIHFSCMSTGIEQCLWQTVGFDRVNQAVKHGMMNWCIARVRDYLEQQLVQE